MEPQLSCELLRRILELERLHKVRKNRALTKLQLDFYSELGEYLSKLEQEFQAEYKARPSSQKALLLREELERAKRLTELIYSEREEKILSAACSAARGGKPDLKHLSKEEKKLYDELLSSLTRTRAQLFRVGKAEVRQKIATSQEAYKIPENYTLVRASADLSFLGSDEVEYNIRKNDVISLPKATAELLCKNRKAELIAINI